MFAPEIDLEIDIAQDIPSDIAQATIG